MGAWRGRRAKGRRGGQDADADNTAWLAELEREAAQADDDEEDWATTLRGRRSPAPPPQAPAPPPQSRPPAPAPEPGWAPPADPTPPPADYRLLGMEPEPPAPSPWDAAPADPPRSPPPADRDWSPWRPHTMEELGSPGRTAAPDPGREEGGAPWRAGETEPDWRAARGRGDEDWRAARDGADEGWRGPRDGGDEGWRSAGVDTPTGTWSPVEPAGREPDYPALFGELYRRSAAQQDPIWEAPPASEPPPDPGQPEQPSTAWPFEETTQSWEPSDRSFVWPSQELPPTHAEWDPPPTPSWDEPPPRPSTPPPDQTAAWSPAQEQAGPWSPAGREPPSEQTAAWSPPAGAGGWAPSGGPPPADWAAAIPTDVPAARRAADPYAATRAWRPDEPVEAEPAVPLGSERTSWAATQAPVEEAGERRRPSAPRGRRVHPDDERPARSWPRVVAIISWIVLLMVFCWYYVFPWLEGVLPTDF